MLELKEKVDFEDAVGAGVDMAEFLRDAAAEAPRRLRLGHNRQEAVAAVAAVGPWRYGGGACGPLR